MDFWQSITGMIHLELTGAEPEVCFEILNKENIILFDLEKEDELTARFWILRRDYDKVSRICQKTGDSVKLCGKRGVYWPLKGLLSRPVLLAGLFLFAVAAMILPTKVLFVRIEGNQNIPANRILEAAEMAGIRFGASRKDVRSEKMKNSLLAEIPQLQWAGVNTEGCVAVISVREREEPENVQPSGTVSSIVASRDGIIQSCTVTRGFGLCAEGQAVKEGQILISGYTDCGLHIMATRAEGEVFANTSRRITAVTPVEFLKRRDVKKIGRRISLLIGKKRINLWKDSGIWDSSCGRMYEEYYITLPGGFRLPAALAVETFYSGHTFKEELPQTEAELTLSLFSKEYLSGHMIAGSILSSEQSFGCEEGVYLLEGDYLCLEMIGREQMEKIGEDYGEDS